MERLAQITTATILGSAVYMVWMDAWPDARAFGLFFFGSFVGNIAAEWWMTRAPKRGA